MSWTQLAEWYEYYSLEPFGDERADLRNGILCALIANVNRDPKRGKPSKPTDFMPFYKPAPPKPMGEKGWARLKSFALAMAPKSKRKREDEEVKS